MSRGNVEVVKALFAAFADRDLVAASTVLDHEVEIRPGLVGGLEGTVYRGLSGNEQFWTDIDATWVEFRIQPEEFRDLGGRVLILGTAFARGRESGVALDQPAAWIAEVRDRKILTFRSFSNQQEAFEAAGLRE
jgi:ketosteroid isomerase-like protein